MEPGVLEKEYKVHVYETGPDGRMNLYSLFDFLQDIASDHAVKLGYGRDDLLRQNHFWVLSRIYAVINEWPLWGDTILVRTWPKGTESVFALRDYEVFDKESRLIASATSSWLIVDQKTKKIQRPDSALSHFNSGIQRRDSLPRNAMKIGSASAGSKNAYELNVRVSDLDINLHANNVKYIKWVTDSYDLDFIMNNTAYSAEINYLAESRFNDSIAVRMSEDKDKDYKNFFNNSILRLQDNTELCRVRIGWKNNRQDK